MTDADLSEFYKLSKPKRPPCFVGVILDRQTDPKLDAKEVSELEAALATDPGIITNAAISAWLKQRGLDAHNQRILTHRKGTCTCGAA